jgi:hypothetical protein
MNTALWKIGGWLLPHRLYVRLADSRRRRAEALNYERKFSALERLAAPNAMLRSRHMGRRGFVLCNGPSVAQQNLLPLRDELVFSVSSGYLHPDYDRIKPRYHCVPQITYGRLTEEDVVRWFEEMHARIGDAELFLSATEEPLVRSHGLFAGRTIHYVFFYDKFDEMVSRQIPDIAVSIPRVQSVAVMGLILALYMGMKNIYLLGTEHSEFITRTYKYAFEPTVLKGKDISTTPTGETVTSRYDDFHQLGRLWRHYRVMREIAEAQGAQIWNATAGGELDEFPRVRLEDVVGP